MAASAQGQPAALRGGGSALSGYREGARAPVMDRGRGGLGRGGQLIFAGRWSSSGGNLRGPPGHACGDARLSAGGRIGVARRGDPRPDRHAFHQCEHGAL